MNTKTFATEATGIALDILKYVPEEAILEMLKGKIDLYLQKKINKDQLIAAMSLTTIRLEPKIMEEDEEDTSNELKVSSNEINDSLTLANKHFVS